MSSASAPRRIVCAATGLAVMVSLSACQKPADARTVLQQVLEHTGTRVSAIDVSSGGAGESARVVSIVDGTMKMSGLNEGKPYSDPIPLGWYAGPLVESTELPIDEALTTLEQLKSDGNCDLPDVATSSTPAGIPALWYICGSKVVPASGKLGGVPVPHQIDFTDPASFRSLFDSHVKALGTTRINQIYYSTDDRAVSIDTVTTDPTGADCYVVTSANADGTQPVLPFDCKTPPVALEQVFDLNDCGGPEAVTEAFNRAMASGIDQDQVFAFQVRYFNGELIWEISSHDISEALSGRHQGTIPHL